MIHHLAQMLKLERPLVGLDTETTGVLPRIDRIVQIGIIKVYPDGKVGEWSSLVNPDEPIPAQATKTHGITDEMVATAPRFSEIAPILYAGLRDCDVCGYSTRFDLAILKSEYQRAGIPTPEWRDVVDVELIFKRHRKRTLTDCVEEYLGEKMEGAHDALVDTRYTMRALVGQLATIEELPWSVRGIHDMIFNEVREGSVCPDNKIVERNGVLILNFTGKSGTPLHQCDGGLLAWIMRQDYVSDEAKALVRAEQNRRNGL